MQGRIANFIDALVACNIDGCLIHIRRVPVRIHPDKLAMSANRQNSCEVKRT